MHYGRLMGHSALPMDAPIRSKRPPRSAGLCTISGCSLPERSRGLCNGHYKRVLYGIPMDRPLRKYSGRKADKGKCAVDGCDSRAHHLEFCKFHYHRQHRGTPIAAPVRVKYGNGHIAKNGYHRLVVDGRQVFGHTLVMERAIGRLLRPHETVHHKNGQRADNRLANLELWSTSQPKGQRVSDKVAWARELLALYGHLFPEDLSQPKSA